MGAEIGRKAPKASSAPGKPQRATPFEKEVPHFPGEKNKAASRGTMGKRNPDREGLLGAQRSGRQPKAERHVRSPKKLTAQRIRNIAEHYVASRECSQAMLQECLERRLKKRTMSLGEDEAFQETAEAQELIFAEVQRLVDLGLISDRRFAEMKARSGLSSGRGTRRILMDLSRKGIAPEVAEDALREASREMTGTLGRNDVDDEDACASAEWEAADTYARKKKFGPYRTVALPDDWAAAQKIWRREASSMARRGFNLDLVRQILDREPDDIGNE